LNSEPKSDACKEDSMENEMTRYGHRLLFGPNAVTAFRGNSK
jgi:hypothetical protein